MTWQAHHLGLASTQTTPRCSSPWRWWADGKWGWKWTCETATLWDGAPLSGPGQGGERGVGGGSRTGVLDTCMQTHTHTHAHTHTHTHTHTYHITAMASGVMTDAKKKGMYRREKAPNAVAPLNRHASKG